MEYYKFLFLVFNAIHIARTVLANWMAQHRPLEGQKFHWTDGIIDLISIILSATTAYFFLGL